MKAIRLLSLVVLLVVVIVAVGAAVVYSDATRSPLPQTSGSLDVAGLQAQVEILRDDWGVPHIYGSSLHDLFFAQGYAQAQDRWWQMEFYRHTGNGTLEELTGKNDDLFGTDIFIRTVGWRRTAEQQAAQLSGDEKIMLEAFSEGVNAYIGSRAPADLALEYTLLGVTGVNITIDPWTPADTLVWGKVMAWNLTDSYSYKLVRQQIVDAVGVEMANSFTPPFPYDQHPTILYPEDLPVTDASLQTAPPSVASDQPMNAGIVMAGSVTATERDSGIGSNNWVATGSMTANGTPLLANDPHLGIGMPSIWYEIGLHCLPVSDGCPLDVVGFALAPSPGVIIGHNARIAWGVTNVGADVQDLYLLTINPENPLQYQWNGEWRDMTVHDEEIRFGDGEPPVTIQVRETHLGTIINDNQIDEMTGEVLGFNHVDPMALRWTGSDPDTLFSAALQLDLATDWESFRDALRLWDVPSQNFVYADVTGNIGYQTPGRIPIRPAGQDGLTPIPATSDADVWQGYIPFDSLPRVFNPARDYIVTANQAVVPMRYYDQLADALGAEANYLLSYHWAYGERAQRITDLLNEFAPNTVESYQRIQGDNMNLSAEAIAPYLAALDLEPGELADARDFLIAWDFHMNIDSAPAALFGQFNARLLDNLFNDQLPADVEADNHELWSAVVLLEQPDNAWWDDSATPDAVETRDDILTRSLSEALDATIAALGEDRSQWRWGDLHTATFVSNPLGASGIELIEGMVNRGPVATGGTSDSVNATGWNPASGNFAVRSLPSMRMIVDVADFDRSLTMHTTGQSGHPSSAHYDDMIDSWRMVEYHPMLWSREQVEAAAADRLILNPAAAN